MSSNRSGHLAFDEELGRAYQANLQANSWDEVDLVSDQTSDDVLGNPQDVFHAEEAATSHTAQLAAIETQYKDLENKTNLIASQLRLSDDDNTNNGLVIRALRTIEKLSSIPEIAEALKNTYNIDTNNKELCGKLDELSHQLVRVSAEIKSLEAEIAKKETPLAGLTQVVPDVFEKFLANALEGVSKSVKDLAIDTMTLVGEKIAQDYYHERLSRSGLAKWLTLDPGCTLFLQKADNVRPHDHADFLLMATDPNVVSMNYGAVHDLVQSLSGRTDDYLRRVICTFEVALPVFVKRLRDKNVPVNPQTMFSCLRIAELLIRIVPLGQGQALGRVYMVAKQCTINLARPEGPLCAGMFAYIDSAVRIGRLDAQGTIVENIHQIAKAKSKILPYLRNAERLFIADDDNLLLVTQPLNQSSVQLVCDKDIEMVFVHAMQLELRIMKLGFVQEVARNEEEWYETNLPRVSERLYNLE